MRCTILAPRSIRARVYGGRDPAKKLEHDGERGRIGDRLKMRDSKKYRMGIP